MPKSTLQLLVQGMSNNDTVGGATPSHQQEMQAINAQLWGTGDNGEDALPVPLVWRQYQMTMKLCQEWKEEQFAQAIKKRREQLAEHEAQHHQA